MDRKLNEHILYVDNFLRKNKADMLFDRLITYQELTSMMRMEFASGGSSTFNFGKLMFLDRRLKEEDRLPESNYGNSIAWTADILSVKKLVEAYLNQQFQVCVCIYYPDGNSGVDYHSDPPAFGDTSIIASLSLGEEREFLMREKASFLETKQILAHGSLLIMKNDCQMLYEHCLPVNSIYTNPRINLTFRKYGFDKNPA